MDFSWENTRFKKHIVSLYHSSGTLCTGTLAIVVLRTDEKEGIFALPKLRRGWWHKQNEDFSKRHQCDFTSIYQITL